MAQADQTLPARGSAKFRHLGAAAAVALAAAPAGASAADISIELNKLEPSDKGCRAHIVVDNTSSTAYQVMKLDLVVFQTDGVIGRRLLVELGPLKATKKTVKLFSLDGTPCDKIGSFLINDIPECQTDAGGARQCLDAVSVKSLTNVQLSK